MWLYFKDGHWHLSWNHLLWSRPISKLKNVNFTKNKAENFDAKHVYRYSIEPGWIIRSAKRDPTQFPGIPIEWNLEKYSSVWFVSFRHSRRAACFLAAAAAVVSNESCFKSFTPISFLPSWLTFSFDFCERRLFDNPKNIFCVPGRNESPAATSSTCKDLRQFCFTQIGKCLKVVTYPFSA